MRATIDLGRWNMYRLVPLAVVAWAPANRVGDALISYVLPQSYTPAETVTVSRTQAAIGDDIAGYAITSDFGARTAPCPGCSEWHSGVDLATPIGTELKAPKAINVYCWWDVGGGGNVANITSDDTSTTLQALHLETCVSGDYAQGEVFGLTGDTGNGTGPHLDVRWKSGAEPVIEDIEPLLTGKPAKGDAIARAGLQMVDDIKRHEGYSSTPYLDPAGIPTIGYGTTYYPDGSPVTMGDAAITQDQAEAYLNHDIAQTEAAVKESVSTTLNQNELDALTSFTYNVGAQSLHDSTLVEKLNEGDKTGAADEFDRWVHGDGVVLPGLVKRRAAEKQLFNAP